MNYFRIILILCLLYIPVIDANASTNTAGEIKTTETSSQNCTPTTTGSSDEESKLSKYKDLYFILGSPNTKVQISFKYKPAKKLNIYLGYTQIMFWDLNKQSMPFKDVNYNPEVFYRIMFPNHTFVKALDVGLYEHKSNGRDGDSSRAWSGSYLKIYTIAKFYKWTFNWDTKAYIFYNIAMDATNWDLRNYLGFWDTKIYFVNFYEQEHFVDRVEMYFSFYSGGRFSQSINKGGQELGVKIRMGWGKVYPYLFFQLFHGYAESLLDYNRRYWAYRVGLAF